MSEILAFAGEHPIVAVLIIWSLASLSITIVQQPFRAWNRYLRSKNILAHGWPKAPLDADGDVVHPEKDAS